MTLEELITRYGKPERIDSAAGAILSILGLSAAVPSGSVVMVHRYGSVEAFEAYKKANPVKALVANPESWTITNYGPAIVGIGVYGLILITPTSEREKMADPDKPEPKADQTNRLSAQDFLAELDLATGWMLWENPAFGELELITKDATGKLTPFHGPNPLTTEPLEYAKFVAQVAKLADEKDQ